VSTAGGPGRIRVDLEERPFRPEVEVGGDPCDWFEGDTDVLDDGRISR
jgi:hypothetical protein